MLIEKVWPTFSPLVQWQLLAKCDGNIAEITLGDIRDATERSRLAVAMAGTIVAERRRVGT